MTAIEVTDLHKRYGRTTALDGVSFTVHPGEIFGLLGRNGAGKSTTVAAIAGLIRPDRGTVRVLGHDPVRERATVRRVLGVQLQDAALHPALTVRELIRLHRGLHADGLDPDFLIDALNLDHRRDTRFEQLSGGEAQRVSIAAALAGKPRVAVLDELTTGLDPEARRDIWRIVTDLRADGVSVLLVSHAMEEVERLCDRVALLDHGRLLALDTPAALAAQTGRDTLDEAFLALTGGTR
ncbi:ABC transporter ATP-binding protein [Paractinoplanes rishiriensis]|uniref:ABC transporter ATP-binding protein n=1 Tax=Paractinoplanes rishiriensis TaxID=1050105 RepID=A0A919K1W0_9ACTN|nr:ABC transporter ATP-binding protein [Actinoplanes rishiriensis]GIE98743.1 ABC transporter ATP-binding protein [Actinoplanes rishiriensis]